MMRVIHIVLVCAVFMLAACSDGNKSGTATSSGQKLAAKDISLATLKLRNLDGSELDVTTLAGKRVFVNFWATWCKPCLAEMPSIERATELLAAKNVVMLAASDEKLDRISKFKDKNSYSFNIVATEADLGVLEIFALPTTFIFDEQGKLVFKETGAREWDSPESIKLINETNKL
ncbi:MAG: TlpA disulfide reductase family protein [Imperialibacter sp.]|uniref:TlpA family protein disulfide reductase n=1 Tax=Imperialibacter sp. TaxID=2038411 RepID=UPI0032ECE7E2